MLEMVRMTIKNKKKEKFLIDFEKKLEVIFTKKFPELPKKVKEVIVKYGPYLAVVLLILSIPIILGLVGLIMVTTPLVLLNGDKGFSYIISILFGLVMMILQIMAISGLFKRQIKAWRLLFYISLISAISNLLRMEIVGLIVGTGLSWYILFQIKNYYK